MNFIIYSLINYELILNEYIFITRIDMKKIIIILRIFYLVEKCRKMKEKKEPSIFPSAIKSTTHGSPSFMRIRRKKIGSAFKISANATATQPTKMPAQKP